MTRYTLTIPATLNSGALVSVDDIDLIESRLLDIVEGFTLTHGFGAWKSPDGAVYREPVRVYAVDTDRPEYIARPLRELAEYVALALDQEAVYLTHAEIGAQLVRAPVLA